MIRFLAIALFLFMQANPAQAIELTFKFDVNSSGPDIYACNAGLRHAAPNNQVCYIEGTQTACSPSSCSGNNCEQNCKCTGLNGGAYRMDFMKAKWGNLYGNAGTPNSIVKDAGTTSYNQLFSDNSNQADNAWGRRIDQLSFNLGSERYGAEYFVDVCFNGSQIEYYENGVAAPNALWAQASATDFSTGSNLSYKALSGVAVKAEWTCDLQGYGDYLYARNNQNQYDTFDNEAKFSNSGASGDIVKSSSVTTLGANAVQLFDRVWINQDSKAPRFCKVRYWFAEKAVNNMRAWQRHGAQMCTFTRIEEPALF